MNRTFDISEERRHVRGVANVRRHGEATYDVGSVASLAPRSSMVCVDSVFNGELHLTRACTSVALGVKRSSTELNHARSWGELVIAAASVREKNWSIRQSDCHRHRNCSAQ